MQHEARKGILRRRFLGSVIWVALVTSLFVAGTSSAQQKWTRHDDLFSASFPTEDQGWTCGRWGTILHTSDGGLTWTPQESGTGSTLGDIFFINARTGWAVGNGGTILHTGDAGETWRSQESPVPYFHMGVHFVSPERGWIASDKTHILYTENGGQTWQVQFNDNVYRLKSISFSDERHGWAVGEYGYTFHTRDGGRTWEHQGGYLRYNEETGLLEGGLFLYDVLAMDPRTAIAVGIDGTVIRTEDGGKTWKTVETRAPRVPLFSVASRGRGTVVIAGKGVCLFSENGGQTWQNATFRPPVDYSWIYGIAPSGPSRFLTVGLEGAIYRRNEDKIWERIDY